MLINEKRDNLLQYHNILIIILNSFILRRLIDAQTPI